jgi:hypothetical protein
LGRLNWGVAAVILLSTTATIAQFIDYGVFDLRIQALDADTHASIFGAISLLALQAAIFAAVVDAGTEFRHRTHAGKGRLFRRRREARLRSFWSHLPMWLDALEASWWGKESRRFENLGHQGAGPYGLDCLCEAVARAP